MLSVTGTLLHSDLWRISEISLIFFFFFLTVKVVNLTYVFSTIEYVC